MKGKMTISKQEVRGMVEAWVRNNALTLGRFRITEITVGGYGAHYEPALDITFTNEAEVQEEA